MLSMLQPRVQQERRRADLGNHAVVDVEAARAQVGQVVPQGHRDARERDLRVRRHLVTTGAVLELQLEPFHLYADMCTTAMGRLRGLTEQHACKRGDRGSM